MFNNSNGMMLQSPFSFPMSTLVFPPSGVPIHVPPPALHVPPPALHVPPPALPVTPPALPVTPPQSYSLPPQAFQMQPSSNRKIKTGTLGYQPTTQMMAARYRVPTSALPKQSTALWVQKQLKNFQMQPQHPASQVGAYHKSLGAVVVPALAYQRKPQALPVKQSGVKVQQPTTQVKPPSMIKIGFQMEQ